MSRKVGNLFASAALLLLLIPAMLGNAYAQGQSRLMTHHIRSAVQSGQAQRLADLDVSEQMHLAFMLAPRKQAELDRFLQDLQDPSTPIYHQFLTVQQFTDTFGPTEADYQAVINFVEANGMTVTSTSPNRMVLDVTAPVESVERALHVKMGLYKHPHENRSFYAPDREPSIALSVPLWRIAGLDNYSLPKPLYKKAADNSFQGNATGSGTGGSFLGSDRRAAYYGGTALNGSGQTVALFQLDGYDIRDVQNYFANVGQPLNVPINNVLLLGASPASDGDDVEQVIDIIDAISMAPGLSQVRVYIAPRTGFSSGTSDVAILNSMATDNIAKQVSISWAWKPADPNSDTPIFQEFAAQGQSVFVASGDSDSWVSGDFAYPAEDAYVTAVGGTNLTTTGAGGPWQSETAWGGSATSCAAGTGSGGGISLDNIGIPDYQTLPGVITSANRGSTTRRNAPDVAAEANCDNYYCANGSCGTGLGGTSLAAPTWAGFLALVNQNNATNGKPSYGFVNGSIYSIGVGSAYSDNFHDITTGDNGGYSAVAGYDLVTGWGSPIANGWLTYAPAPSCKASTSCGGSGNVIIGFVNLSCTAPTSISSMATICGGTFGCQTWIGPSGVLTSTGAGGAQGSNNSGSCYFQWSWGGHTYSQTLSPH